MMNSMLFAERVLASEMLSFMYWNWSVVQYMQRGSYWALWQTRVHLMMSSFPTISCELPSKLGKPSAPLPTHWCFFVISSSNLQEYYVFQTWKVSKWSCSNGFDLLYQIKRQECERLASDYPSPYPWQLWDTLHDFDFSLPQISALTLLWYL